MTDAVENMEVVASTNEPVIDELVEEFDELEDKIAVNPSCAVDGYKSIMTNSRTDDDAVKVKEKCIYG